MGPEVKPAANNRSEEVKEKTEVKREAEILPSHFLLNPPGRVSHSVSAPSVCSLA